MNERYFVIFHEDGSYEQVVTPRHPCEPGGADTIQRTIETPHGATIVETYEVQLPARYQGDPDNVVEMKRFGFDHEDPQRDGTWKTDEVRLRANLEQSIEHDTPDPDERAARKAKLKAAKGLAALQARRF